MSEGDLWKDMHKNVNHLGHFSRVESHETSAGIPDVDYCINGTEGHVELKFGRDRAPKIRATQVKWFRNRVRAGGKPWLFTEIRTAKRSIYMLHEGKHVGHLARMKDLGVWRSTAKVIWDGSMDWRLLISILTYGDLR